MVIGCYFPGIHNRFFLYSYVMVEHIIQIFCSSIQSCPILGEHLNKFLKFSSQGFFFLSLEVVCIASFLGQREND